MCISSNPILVVEQVTVESLFFEVPFRPSRWAVAKVHCVLGKKFGCKTYRCVKVYLSGMIVLPFNRLLWIFLRVLIRFKYVL